MRTARSWGRPLDLGDGYEQTPVELRMGYKILKDAGIVPPEVALMREIAASGITLGVVTVVCQHTSCSLTINENADPRVLDDLAAYLRALVPEASRMARV